MNDYSTNTLLSQEKQICIMWERELNIIYRKCLFFNPDVLYNCETRRLFQGRVLLIHFKQGLKFQIDSVIGMFFNFIHNMSFKDRKSKRSLLVTYICYCSFLKSYTFEASEMTCHQNPKTFLDSSKTHRQTHKIDYIFLQMLIKILTK